MTRGQAAVVRFKARDTSICEFGWLCPQAESKVNSRVVQSAGFSLITMPFADDLRDPDAEFDHAHVEIEDRL